MQANVLPGDASMNTVTWSVFEADGVTVTDKANISATGLLTALKDGVVKVIATSTDGTLTQGSKFIIISGQSSLPNSVPFATLTGPNTVNMGTAFSTNIGVGNVTSSVYGSLYALDLTLTFGTNVVNFVSAESLRPGFAIVVTKTDIPGRIRLIAASQGPSGAINASGDLFKLNWTAYSLAQPATANLSLTDMTASNSLGQTMQVTLANEMVQIQNVNKSVLQGLINTAQAQYNSSVEGIWGGQYPAGSKAALLSAINTALSVVANSESTQQQVDSAANTLNQAIQQFNASVITSGAARGDLNGDSLVNIGDLAVVAVNYGKSIESPDWDAVKFADYNHDGNIDILDLAAIANLILQ